VQGLRSSLRQLHRLPNILRGQDIWQSIQLECERIDLGNDSARWCISPSGLTASSVVYSFGVGEEFSFDLELISRFGVRLHAFDPTPRAIQWVRSQAVPEGFVFHDYGIADYDGTCKFFPPQNPSFVSHTIVERGSPSPAIEVPVHRLSTIMGMLGHRAINLLKMDIEGAEYRVIRDLLASKIRVEQLLIEFHHRWPELGVDKTRAAIRMLNQAGYRIFNVSPSGEEYSFKACEER
jgi:FkbM family methyltransferase